ncbi:MAG: CRISPR-associated endoribonuclease Cas6 [Bacteroidetes bacterium]|nr:CRISPR-associated endoribonuclease Cas6 [Bacteroidota bacterium]
MRLQIRFLHNRQAIPFNYQYELARALHRWLGPDNPWHGKTYSPFNFGSLQGLKAQGNTLVCHNSQITWWVAAWQANLLKTLLQGMLQSSTGPWGMHIQEVQLASPPHTEGTRQYFMDSPLVLRQRQESGPVKYLTWQDTEANTQLHEQLMRKLHHLDIHVPETDVQVAFDTTYPKAKTRLITLKRDTPGQQKEVKVRGSLCPVRVTAPPEVHAAIWSTGLGANTGIGFGGVK